MLEISQLVIFFVGNQQLHKQINNRKINLIHLNIQSIGNSINGLEIFIEEENAHIVTLTEHWKDSNQLAAFNLSGYELISCFCREINQHDGCAIYCSKDIVSKQRNDLTSLSVSRVFECVACEYISSGYKVVIITIYRPYHNQMFLLFLINLR